MEVRGDVRERGGLGMAWGNGMGGRDGYGSREVYIATKGAILRFARDLSPEGFPGVQGDDPSLFLEQQRKRCLNWSCPIATLMNILHITIEPSSGNGWR